MRTIFPNAQTETSGSAPDHAALIGDGRQVFITKCGNCHGGIATPLPKIETCGVAGVRVGEVGGTYVSPTPGLRAMGGVWSKNRLHDVLSHRGGRIGDRMTIPEIGSVHDLDALVEYLMSIPVISARDPSNPNCARWDLIDSG